MRRGRPSSLRVLRVLAALVVAGAAPCAACGAFFDLSTLGSGGGAPDAAPEASPTGADAGPASDGAAEAADAGALDEDSSAPCLAEAGAPMKRIGLYCIDTVEVTNGMYGVFLARADAGAALGVVPAACAQDGDRVPTENWPSPPAWTELPVTGVSWCDAHAFCAYAGKRLCGKRGGGSLTPTAGASTTSDAITSEWYRACSKAGTKRLPYGNEPVVGECATVNELRPASGRCEGGYVGLFDMVGNTEEWVDACDSSDSSASCVVQGGSALDSLADCTTAKPYPRHLKRPLVGFRCCAD